jgi:hypothetical protein
LPLVNLFNFFKLVYIFGNRISDVQKTPVALREHRIASHRDVRNAFWIFPCLGKIGFKTPAMRPCAVQFAEEDKRINRFTNCGLRIRGIDGRTSKDSTANSRGSDSALLVIIPEN